MDLNLSQFLGPAALLAALGGGAYYLRSIPTYLYSKVRQRLVHTVRVYPYDDLFTYLEAYLSDHHSKQYRDVEASLHEKDNKGGFEVVYKQEESLFIIKYAGKRILVTKNKEKWDKAQSLKERMLRTYILSGIRAKKAIDLFLKEVLEYYDKRKNKDILEVSYNNQWGDWNSKNYIRAKSMENVVLCPSLKREIIEDLKSFEASEEWYIRTSIPYKRGYCLYGPPGTGKTTLALAIGKSLNRKVYSLNINSIDEDSRLVCAFSQLPTASVLLIEDIDKVFEGRNNVKESAKVNFSTFINCLDGAMYKHGIITIITTNHFEKLDPALVREGRMDKCLCIPNALSREISTYLSLFYSTPLHIEKEINMRMSKVQGICLQNKSNPQQAIKEILTQATSLPPVKIDLVV